MNDLRTIVRAFGFHAEALAAIHARAFPPSDCWSVKDIGSLLALPEGFGLLHPAGGMLLGRSVADEAEVLTLAVAPAVRRHRIGAALVTRAAEEARRRGARSLFLEVSDCNRPARRLYEAAGFAEIARRPGYYPGGVDAVVMKLKLPDRAEDEAG